jgi:putative DNA primase/helicase
MRADTDKPRLYLVPKTPASFPDARIRNTLASVVHALTHLPEWTGVLASSELDQRIVFRRPPPFRASCDDGDASGPTLRHEGSHASAPVRDRDIDRIRHWFEGAAGVVLSKQNVVDAVRMVADESSFHPVREYLETLVWDGVPRVDRWLETYAAVRPESEAHASLVRSVARKWLLSCVARAMRPGCKVDTMLILEGRQGIGKSRALAALAGEGFFSDAAIDFASKDACQTIQGAWIFELAELDALLRRESSTVKAFISRSSDRFRLPYGRAPETVPRSVVFAGTVNHGGYLRDTTGNRRYWVVRCEGPLLTDALGAARDALWAEATHLYRRGEAWHLGPEHEALMAVEHEARIEVDPWEEAISLWARARESRPDPAPFTMNDVLEEALGVRTSSKNSNVTTRVSRLLGGLGYERRRRATLPRTYHYVRTDVSPSHRPSAPPLTSREDPSQGEPS